PPHFYTLSLHDALPISFIDAGQWWYGVHSREFSLSELLSSFQPREVQAVLDCTSGWWSEQIWSGVGFLDVVRAAGVSATATTARSEEHTSELQSRGHLV